MTTTDDAPAATPSLSDTIRTMLRERRHGDLVALARRAVAAAPDNAEVWNLLGVGLRLDGGAAAAMACHGRALDLDPANVTAMVNLGTCCSDLDRLDETVEWYRRVVARAPSAIAWTHLGVARHEAGDPEGALPDFAAALALDPLYARAHVERAHALLRLGRFDEGWPEFEWRWRLGEAGELGLPALDTPRWDGRQLDGPLLVLPEQGFGDTILCARFLTGLRGRVPQVILACKPELARLFAGLEGVDAIVPAAAPPPAHAAHVPMMSLPFLTMRDRAPPPPARLAAPPESRQRLAPLIAAAGGRLRVGIVWSGSVTFKANAQRAVGLDRFLPFAAIPGLRLFSLQKGPPARDLQRPGAREAIVDLGAHCRDFADTAAAIELLDLVVMTDSSVAHLAGSLGRPVWNLLSFSPYWLYGTGGEQGPWYGSMRLLRQRRPGDWAGLFAEVEKRLREAAAA
jgi:hypothetical protein